LIPARAEILKIPLARRLSRFLFAARMCPRCVRLLRRSARGLPPSLGELVPGCSTFRVTAGFGQLLAFVRAVGEILSQLHRVSSMHLFSLNSHSVVKFDCGLSKFEAVA